MKLPNEAGLKLREVLDRILALDSLKPEDTDHDGDIDKTKCNFGVQMAAEEIGYAGKLLKKRANDILAFIEAEAKKHKAWAAWNEKKEGPEPPEGEWCEAVGVDANIAANLGVFCIAGSYGKPSGHVATLYPGAMLWSTKWKTEVPVVANIGQRNGVMGANWAFKEPPRYFICRVSFKSLNGEDQGAG